MSKSDYRRPIYLYKRLYIFLSLFLVLYIGYKLVQSYRQSLFTSKSQRINFVVYGAQTTYYSIDKRDTRNYLMYFYPDLRMSVPGGYGNYPVGSLGKLAKLDNNPALLKKTFSIATTSFVDLYFYTDSEKIYDGNELPKKAMKPSVKDIAFMESNASILDRLYIILQLTDKNDDDFHLIAYESEVNKVHNDVFFEETSFIKNSIGLLFQKQYRDEQKNIQLQYTKNYDVAEKISTLLEGNGIRVNDITLDMNKSNTCQIIEDTEIFSQTAHDLAFFFECSLKKGKTDVYDIIMVLGRVETDWEI